MICKVVVNKDSGRCARLDLCKLLKTLNCPNAEIEYITSNGSWDCQNATKLVVCGGDGTLKNALEKCQNKQTYFVPCGTLNDAKSLGETIATVGKVNDELFSYVCATGSFTEIGYQASKKCKQKYKAFAYLPLAFSHYRCHQIDAKVNVDGKVLDGNFTLLMVLKSKRCCAFNFNKLYTKNQTLYLLAVHSFGKNTFWNKAKMFWTFFRIFFVGLHKPKSTKKFTFVPFEKATITLKNPCDFCLDGEKRTISIIRTMKI